MKSDCELCEVGIREGEKLHEVMVTREDSFRTQEYENHYIIYPNYSWWDANNIIPGGTPVEIGFEYSSEKNSVWLDSEQLRMKLRTDIERH